MESSPSPSTGLVRNYFVDEAGDTTLFDRRGRRVLIGSEGCSTYFILGVIDIPDINVVKNELITLRDRLLQDPYFKGVPSMNSKARKTALAFHAKDDLPEVRREVLSLLQDHPELRFFAVVKDKRAVLRYVRDRKAFDPAYRYQSNELYDYLVRRLFKNLLHKADQNSIVFARRGNSDRTESLFNALMAARERFCRQWNVVSKASISIEAKSLHESAGLQVADYFLWSLQRFYERQEDRFLNYLWSSFRIVMDIDDQRNHPYGEYYHQKNPLALTAIQNRG